MSKKKSFKRDLVEWGIFIAIITTLYLTGLHTPVLGALQGLLLKTGIIQPKIETEDVKMADFDFLLQDVEGKTVSFESFKGKTVFMNLWATWCPPCIAEMPDINNLYNSANSDNVIFVMISLDDEFAKAKTFVEKKGFGFPIYALGSRLPEVYSSNAIPTTYVIAPDGKIVVTQQGMAKYNTDKFKKLLSDLSAK